MVRHAPTSKPGMTCPASSRTSTLRWPSSASTLTSSRSPWNLIKRVVSAPRVVSGSIETIRSSGSVANPMPAELLVAPWVNFHPE